MSSYFVCSYEHVYGIKSTRRYEFVENSLFGLLLSSRTFNTCIVSTGNCKYIYLHSSIELQRGIGGAWRKMIMILISIEEFPNQHRKFCFFLQLYNFICIFRNIGTMLHIIKCCTGTGILTMPYGFKHAGLFNGVTCTVFLMLFSSYCVNMLVNIHYFQIFSKKHGKTLRSELFHFLGSLRLLLCYVIILMSCKLQLNSEFLFQVKCQYIICKRNRVPMITFSDTLVAALTVGPISLRKLAKYSG